MALSATQRKLIMDLLDIGTGPDGDEFGEYLFQTRKALSGEGIPTNEHLLLQEYLKTMDTAMKRLALYHIGATEARNEDEAQESLKDLAGMWSDICTLLRSPTLDTLNSLESFLNSKLILAKVSRLDYLKSHLCHELSSDDESISSRVKRPKVEKSQIKIPTSNKFEILAEGPSTSAQPTQAEEESVEMEAPPTEEEERQNLEAAKRTRVEPIFIEMSKHSKALIQHINGNILQTPVIGKLVGENIKIVPGSPDDYRALTSYLKDNSINFHAILPKAEKPMKVLIKGLGGETPVEEITAELIEMGFEPIYISALRNRTNGGKLPLFHVTLKQTPNWEQIYNIKILQSMYVTVQRFYSTRPKQCYRCQGFGHSSQTCFQPPKCLKCAQNHNTKECIKPRDIKATCANCKGAHTANYQGCPANPRNIKPQLPFKERYFQHLKAEKERKKTLTNTFKRPDAPLPKIPAWLTRNENIYLPPGKTAEKSFPPLPTPRSSDPVSAQPIRDDAAPVTPTTPSKAAKKAQAAAAANESTRNLFARHAEILNTPATTPLPAISPVSEITDMIGTIREFQEIMQTLKLKELILILKDTAQKMKDAPTEMDKLAVLLETANVLSQIFPST